MARILQSSVFTVLKATKRQSYMHLFLSQRASLSIGWYSLWRDGQAELTWHTDINFHSSGVDIIHIWAFDLCCSNKLVFKYKHLYSARFSNVDESEAKLITSNDLNDQNAYTVTGNKKIINWGCSVWLVSVTLTHLLHWGYWAQHFKQWLDV